MVRSIVGTLVEVGVGRWPAAEVAAILASRDRARAGRTAPPQGLFLGARSLLTADLLYNAKLIALRLAGGP